MTGSPINSPRVEQEIKHKFKKGIFIDGPLKVGNCAVFCGENTIDIQSISATNPAVVTTTVNHELRENYFYINIEGTGNATVNGHWLATAIAQNTFSIDVNNPTPVGATGTVNCDSVTVVGNLDMTGNTITNVADPVNPQDAATKQYVLDNIGGGGASGAVFHKGSWNAAGNSPDLDTVGSKGDYYVVTVAGTYDMNANSSVDPATLPEVDYAEWKVGDWLVSDGTYWQKVSNGQKSNFSASVAPVASDDFSSGYTVGSRWFDTTADKEYVLLDSTNTAAVWIETTGTGITDHTLLSNNGNNTHNQIDDHIDNSSTIHFTEGSINHNNIANNGNNTHNQIDDHIDNSSTIHFTEGSINHNNIANNGVNSHSVIDDHIDNSSTIHYTQANITTVGTVTTGTWNADTIDVPNGGTGATTHGTGNVLLGAGTSAITSTKAAPAGVFVGTTDTQNMSNKTWLDSLDMGTNKIINVAQPTADQDAATKKYVDTVAAGLSPTESVKLASTGNVDLSTDLDVATIDTVAVNAGDRILLKDQTDATENGIYDVVAGAGNSVRSSDTIEAGLCTFVSEGTLNGDTIWCITTNDPITLGVTLIAWTQFGAPGTFTASNVGVGGVGVFKQLNGTDFEFKKVNAASTKISVVDDTGNNEVDIDLVEGNITIGNLSGAPTGAVVGTTDAQTLSNKTLTLPEINDTSADHQYVIAVSELTADRTTTLPLLGANDTFVFEAHTQTLTNKTIDSDNNTITNIVNADIKTAAAIDADKIHDGSVSNTEYGYLGGVTSAIQTQFIGKANTSHNHDAADVTTGVFPVVRGGTGAATHTSGNVLLGDGVNPVTSAKVAPAGVFVGTFDAQTLTNKTLTTADLGSDLDMAGFKATGAASTVGGDAGTTLVTKDYVDASVSGGPSITDDYVVTGTGSGIVGEANLQFNATGQLQVLEGSTSAPSYTFINGTDTGLSCVGGQQEVTKITFGDHDQYDGSLNVVGEADYFILRDTLENNYYVWLRDIAMTLTDPTPAGITNISVMAQLVSNTDPEVAVADPVKAAIDAISGTPFSVVVTGVSTLYAASVDITVSISGNAVDADASGLANIGINPHTSAIAGHPENNNATPGVGTLMAVTQQGIDKTLSVSIAANETIRINTEALQIVPAGSETVPSLYFNGDQNTGIFHPAADELALTAAGTTRLTVSASGISANTHKITNVVDPTAAQDAATMNYVDTNINPLSVANQADNRILTATATSDALNSEDNLTFDGTTLSITGLAAVDDLDSLTATTLLIGKATATKVEISDAGVITEVQGPLEATDLDSVGAATLLLGKANATKVEIADAGVITEVQGALEATDLDSVGAAILLLGKANATKVEIADAGVITEVQGALEATDLDTVGGATLLLGKANATKVEIADTGVTTEVQGDLTVNEDMTLTGQMLAALNMGNNKITNVVDPTDPQDAATKFYVDGLAAGIDIKASVRLASIIDLDSNASVTGTATYNNTAGTSTRGQITATLAVSDTFTIDGVTLGAAEDGTRVLLKDQASADANGIWTTTVSGTSLTLDRATDYDDDAEVTAGNFMFVAEGAVNADIGYVLITNDPITIGGASGTALTYTQFSAAAAVIAGDGLDKTGNTLSADLKADSGLVIDGIEISMDLSATSITGTLAVSNGGTGATTLADNSLLTGTGTTAIVAEGNLTFDGSLLDVTGAITASGDITANGNIVGDNATVISQIADPSLAQDVATKNYVDNHFTAGDGLDVSAGGEFSADLKAGGGLIIDSTELAVDTTVIAATSSSDQALVEWNADFSEANVQADVCIRKVSDVVTLDFDQISGTSNVATFAKVDIVPFGCRPSTDTYFTVLVKDNGLHQMGLLRTGPIGTVEVYPTVNPVSNPWTSSGSKALLKTAVQYISKPPSPAPIESFITECVWLINTLYRSSIDETSAYSGYTLSFTGDGNCQLFDGASNDDGTWTVTTNGQGQLELEVILTVDTNIPFTWILTDLVSTRMNFGITPGEDELILVCQ